MAHDLETLARTLVADGKGILAADETVPTLTKRFDPLGIRSTEESRRTYREMLFTAGVAQFIGGVIMQDETIHQKSPDGTPLAEVLLKQGILPGIKVDTGAKPMAAFPNETITEGLDGLRERLMEYYQLGARFAKWRAVIDIGEHGMPSYTCVRANSHALARYAALCQDEGIVPIVEPEVLMDGGHDIDRCAEVTTWVLKETFQELFYNRVALEGMVLKPNMTVPGKKSPKRASVAEVADKTLRVLKECVPAAVPGIAFLSGGQSDEDATAHLDAINKSGSLPWRVTFSYGRALQAAPQKAWSGRSENVAAAQRAFGHRAMMNGLASLGQWKADLERKAA